MVTTPTCLALSLFVLGCAQPRPLSHPTATIPRLEARFVSSRYDCFRGMPFADDRLARENRTIGDAWARQGVNVRPELVDPTAEQLLAEASARTDDPIR